MKRLIISSDCKHKQYRRKREREREREMLLVKYYVISPVWSPLTEETGFTSRSLKVCLQLRATSVCQWHLPFFVQLLQPPAFSTPSLVARAFFSSSLQNPTLFSTLHHYPSSKPAHTIAFRSLWLVCPKFLPHQAIR